MKASRAEEEGLAHVSGIEAGLDNRFNDVVQTGLHQPPADLNIFNNNIIIITIILLNHEIVNIWTEQHDR
jgi:hypothetical protein